MGTAFVHGDSFWTYTQSVMTDISQRNIRGVYTTGNHEFYNGEFSRTSTNSTQQNYVVDGKGYEGDDYIIYCLGTGSGGRSH